MHNSASPLNDPLITRVDKWSNYLLVIVVFIPFVVSFGALADLAAANGVNYPFMYPLMIDLSLIIYNLVALRSSLYGERNLYAWALVLIATAISVVLNVLHAPRTVLAMFMAALPPLFILAAFHLVVIRIEQSAKRNRAIATLSELTTQIANARNEHDQLTVQNEALARDVTAGREQLTAVTSETTDAQRELSRLQRELTGLEDELDGEQSLEAAIAARRAKLRELVSDPTVQMTQMEMAEALGVSLSTVRRDLQALNGSVAG